MVTYTDGTKKLSDVVTFTKETEEDSLSDDASEEDVALAADTVTYVSDTTDSDEDGIEDAYEIWDLNSNSNETDSDFDGIADGEEDSYVQTNMSYDNGDKYEYQYDDAGNVTGIIINGVLSYEMLYDDDGNMTEQTDHVNSLTYKYTYDGDDVETITCSNGFQIAYTSTDVVDSEVVTDVENYSEVEDDSLIVKLEDS